MGLMRKGRSRCWIDDHAWWLINVEFQPSGYKKGGIYLNVGLQHLWIVRDHLVFENHERPLGTSTLVPFTDNATFERSMRDVAAAAAETIRRRREGHGEGTDALRKLAAGDDDLNAGIAAALLGNAAEARARLGARVHEAYRRQAAAYVGSPRKSG